MIITTNFISHKNVKINKRLLLMLLWSVYVYLGQRRIAGMRDREGEKMG